MARAPSKSGSGFQKWEPCGVTLIQQCHSIHSLSLSRHHSSSVLLLLNWWSNNTHCSLSSILSCLKLTGKSVWHYLRECCCSTLGHRYPTGGRGSHVLSSMCVTCSVSSWYMPCFYFGQRNLIPCSFCHFLLFHALGEGVRGSSGE